MIDERKNVQTAPIRAHCKCSRLLPYSYPNLQDAPALEGYPEPSHHPTPPPPPPPPPPRRTQYPLWLQLCINREKHFEMFQKVGSSCN